MRDENYWKTRSCRRKVAKKIYGSLLLLDTFDGNPFSDSLKFENYFFNNAFNKEEYFSGFVRLVLKIREELCRQGNDIWPGKPDRIDALRDLDLPRGIEIPITFTNGRVKSNLPCTLYSTPAFHALSQVGNYLRGAMTEMANNLLYRDLNITPESSIKGEDDTSITDLSDDDDDDDDGTFDDALVNLSQELFPADDDDVENNNTPKISSDVLSNNDTQAITTNQRIWVKADLYSPKRPPEPTFKTILDHQDPLKLLILSNSSHSNYKSEGRIESHSSTTKRHTDNETNTLKPSIHSEPSTSHTLMDEEPSTSQVREPSEQKSGFLRNKNKLEKLKKLAHTKLPSTYEQLVPKKIIDNTGLSTSQTKGLDKYQIFPKAPRKKTPETELVNTEKASSLESDGLHGLTNTDGPSSMEISYQESASNLMEEAVPSTVNSEEQNEASTSHVRELNEQQSHQISPNKTCRRVPSIEEKRVNGVDPHLESNKHIPLLHFLKLRIRNKLEKETKNAQTKLPSIHQRPVIKKIIDGAESSTSQIKDLDKCQIFSKATCKSTPEIETEPVNRAPSQSFESNRLPSSTEISYQESTNNLSEEAGPSTGHSEEQNEEQLHDVSSRTIHKKIHSSVKEVPDERVSAVQQAKLAKNKRRNRKRRNAYNSEDLKQRYFRKKVEIAKFELRSLKILHKLECSIKQKQLEKLL